MPTKRVLIVAPEDDDIDGLATSLREHGFAAEVACEGPEALLAFKRARHDIVLVDSDLPGLVLTDLVETIRKAHPATRIIVVTGTDRTSELRRAVEIGVTCYAKKPFDKEGLLLQMRKF